MLFATFSVKFAYQYLKLEPIMRIKTFTFILAFTAIHISTLAQNLHSLSGDTIKTTINSTSVTIEDAVTMAYTNNLSIEAAQYAIKAAEHRKKAAWGLGVPKIGVGAAYTYMSQDIGKIDFNAEKNGLVDFIGTLPIPIPPAIINSLKSLDLSYTLQERDFAIVEATVVAPIFTGGKIRVANNVAKIQISQAQNVMLETRAMLFSEITERYWGLTLAHSAENLNVQLLAAMEHHASDAQKLEQNGMIASTERMYIDMAVSMAKAALTTAKNNTKTINSALGSSVGFKSKYNTSTPLFINTKLESLDFFTTHTLTHSHALEKMELFKKLSHEAVKMERSKFFPTIAAMGGATLWNYQLSDQLPRWVVGATLTWNIFDGLTREHNFQAAKLNQKRVEVLQEKAQIDIKTLVEKLYNQTQSALDIVEAYDSTIEFAEQYLYAKQRAFKEGMATSVELVDAELNLSKAKLERMAAAYGFDTALCNLLAVAGLSDNYTRYLIGDGYAPIN